MPVPSPTALRLGEIHFAANQFFTPKSPTTVTPTANALVLLLIEYSGGSTTPTPVQPSWASQAWTLVAATAEAGSEFAQVAVWWTIAAGSPSAAAVEVNFSAGGFDSGAGGALFEYATDYDATTPIRQFKSVTAASVAGNASLTDTFDAAPRGSSQLIEIGMARGNSTQFFANAAAGWTKPTPVDEGFGQTSYVAYAAGSNGSQYGGDFGDSTPGHDHANGAAFLALEVQGPPDPPPPRIVHPTRSLVMMR